MDAVKMNFDEAIVAHAEWKLKLTLYLQGEGKFDHSIVCQDNQCKLGKWIYSDGKKYANEPAYELLRKTHADFHRSAGNVIKAVDEKRVDSAKKMIADGSEYTQISAAVVESISAVKKRVEEKTNMIMQNVNVGVLVVDQNQVVQSGYSTFCHDLFGTEHVAGQTLCELLGLEGKHHANFRAILGQTFDDILPADLCLSMLPSRVHQEGKVLELHATAIRSNGKDIDFVLFTVSDATKMVALEAENAENTMLLKIMKNRESFAGFVRDSKDALDRLENDAAIDQVVARREIHTIKGNSGMFDMMPLMNFIGHVEDHEKISHADLVSIRSQLLSFVEKFGEALGLAFESVTDEIHSIPERELTQFESQIYEIKDLDRARQYVQSVTTRMRMRSARSVIGPIEERVELLSRRLHKSVKCRLSGETTLVSPRRLGPIIQVLSHVLRNSVDHGIESTEERLDSGKATEGAISIAFSALGDDGVMLTVQDDGRGINTDKLVAKAIASGAITHAKAQKMSHADKLNLIFLDGVTTAEEVTAISGRGVGMSALQASVEGIGGSLRIHSEQGKGTTIEISIPPTSQVQELRKVG